MNAGFVLSFHASFEDLEKKLSGNWERLSETLVLKKFSEKFESVFVFTRDSKSYQKVLPSNVKHVRLFSRGLFWVFGWLVVLYFVLRYKIRIIYVECGPGLPLVFLVNKLASSKVLLNYDNTLFLTATGVKRSVYKFIEGFLLRFVDYIVVASGEIKEWVRLKGMESKILDFVRKGIITKEFDPKKTKPHPVYKKIRGPVLVFINRLDPVKDPITLIKAYKIAKKEIPNLNLIVCGDGSLKKECERLADENVYFLGWVKNIPSVLKKADIHVMSSVYDASPRSLMEAMCMGLPTIATNVGGIPDYLDKKTGILIEPGNPKELAEKIVYLVKHPEIRKKLGKKARKRILENHDLEKNLDMELEFLEKEVNKICFVMLEAGPVFKPGEKESVGGAEFQSYLIGKKLKELGFHVSFLIKDSNQKTEILDGIKLVKVPYSRFNFLFVFWKMLKINADVYYQRTGGFITGLVGLVCWVRRKRFVFHVSNIEQCHQGYPKEKSFLVKWFYRFGIKRANTIIVQTEDQKKELYKNFKLKSIVLPNVIDIPKVSETKKQDFVLWVGSLQKRKRPELFWKLAESLPGYKFYMIGGKEASDLGLEIPRFSNFKFLGFVPLSRIDYYFRNAAVFVNTSLPDKEGFPNTYLQAWSNFTPVVTLEFDPDEIICRYKLGFHSKTFGRLVKDVGLLMKNKKKREGLGRNGRKYVEKNHNINNFIKNYIEVFTG